MYHDEFVLLNAAAKVIGYAVEPTAERQRIMKNAVDTRQ